MRQNFRKRRKSLLTLLGVGVAAAALVPTGQMNQPALTRQVASRTGNSGYATHFDGLGKPFGACGIPQSALRTNDFAALNTANGYGSRARTGQYDRGHNCGRWVRVQLGQFCSGGTNDGAPHKPFCRGGTLRPNHYTGATLTLLVADRCSDPNAWCRESPGHLDLSTASLGHFRKNGAVVTGLKERWTNPVVSWSFVHAPNYHGDITIGFLQGAKTSYSAIAIAHLPDGIHGVDHLTGGAWHKASNRDTAGQAFVIAATHSGGTHFRIRVHSANDALIQGGRNYSFDLPSGCRDGCPSDFTEVAYRIN
ncbi:hypothetical protein AB0F30_21955 [Streptomyces sp. NPDC029006]|uniref:hypothetical protein n=1 Tax=Streptomyces sp. NPDC029006 TaxID=3155467 RepID=UPI0033F23D6A